MKSWQVWRDIEKRDKFLEIFFLRATGWTSCECGRVGRAEQTALFHGKPCWFPQAFLVAQHSSKQMYFWNNGRASLEQLISPANLCLQCVPLRTVVGATSSEIALLRWVVASAQIITLLAVAHMPIQGASRSLWPLLCCTGVTGSLRDLQKF